MSGTRCEHKENQPNTREHAAIDTLCVSLPSENLNHGQNINALAV